MPPRRRLSATLESAFSARKRLAMSGSPPGDDSSAAASSGAGSHHKHSAPDAGKKYGCVHYERRCAWISPCCGKIYSCRFCHDEKETHQINRHAVAEIICLLCNKRQAVNQCCSSCSVEFGRYFCPICRLFDDKDKKQFHCDQCGICRVDGRENFFHCPKCDICLGINLQGSHKCVEKVARANCPVCLEDLHSSRESLSVLSCGHITHRKCFRRLLRTGNYACPLCCQSMVDMQNTWHSLDREVANTPMPDEYRNLHVTILCRDCHKVSSPLFHVIGLKCGECGSYNTCQTSASNENHADENANQGPTNGSALVQQQQPASEAEASSDDSSYGSAHEYASSTNNTDDDDDQPI